MMRAIKRRYGYQIPVSNPRTRLLLSLLTPPKRYCDESGPLEDHSSVISTLAIIIVIISVSSVSHLDKVL